MRTNRSWQNGYRRSGPLLKGKKLTLYTTSGAAADDPVLQEGFKSSFNAEILSELKYFSQGGRMVFGELKGLHRFMMNLGQKLEKDPKLKKPCAGQG